MTAIKWTLAARVAGRMAERYPLEGTYHEALFARQAPELVERAAELVEAETRLRSVGSPEVVVVTRRQWAESNIAVFTRLMAPAEARLAERSRGLARGIVSRVVAAEVGALLGVLARRVLGQYELVLPSGGEDAGDTVMFVGANVLWLERLHEFRPSEFRFWVALHECTHRLQFVGVPWLRDYFLELVSELVSLSVPERGRVSRIAGEMRRASANGEPVIGEAGLMGLLASPGQRKFLDRVQALMSLLEGHGHVMMDRIGARELVTQRRMSRILRMRRKDPRMAAFFRISGLEMKMRQYELGEHFVLEVEREAGLESLDRVWRGPEDLPTLEEIKEPSRWLERAA
ncbi:MAG: zinc-dependent metalloprotease [Acidimicrobiia bacterium]